MSSSDRFSERTISDDNRVMIQYKKYVKQTTGDTFLDFDEWLDIYFDCLTLTIQILIDGLNRCDNKGSSVEGR